MMMTFYDDETDNFILTHVDETMCIDILYVALLIIEYVLRIE